MHNLKHSKTRIKIEHTFGIWKGRWRILKYINVNCPKKATKIIAACCLLHNFCLQIGDEWELEINDIPNDENEEVDEYLHVHNENIGIQKRNEISRLFL